MIFVNTNLAAAAGAVLAMITSWMKFGKPEVGMSLNGALAGLVGITAGCANVTPLSAVIIGAAAGVIVVLSVLFFDKVRVDDPVGLRVSPEEEMEGLDLAEHGGNAYPDFEVSSYGGVGTAMGPGSPSATGEPVGQFKPVEQT
jgi:ammonia channel protein AmtB